MTKFIPISEPNIGPSEIRLVNKAVKSGWVSSLGEYINEFEKEFAKYSGRRYGVAVSNGTVALHLALLTLGIGKGDEVIVPNLTFVASANAVKYAGARPIFAEVEADTWNIDPNKIERKITRRTKAIMPVPLFGHSCDMGPILKIAKKHKLIIIEDAAESHGGKYHGKMVGSFGDISCFSFYGNKTITSGEGGMCLTNSRVVYEKMRLLRDHAMDSHNKYWHPSVGYNYRMTNLQAALGVAQFRRIEEFIKIKRANAGRYIQQLKGVKGIQLPAERPGVLNTYWMFSILITNPKISVRKYLIPALQKRGIDSRPFFYPMSELPMYKRADKDLAISKRLARQGISLPSSTKLKFKDVDHVCKVLKELL